MTDLRFSLPLILCSFFLLMNVAPAMAQQQQDIKNLVERLAPDLAEDVDLAELWDQLSYYAAHPIDLNHTTVEELKKLVILSPLQISNFFTHLTKNGALLDLAELQSIDAFDLQTIENIQPFVTLKLKSGFHQLSFNKLITNGNNDFIYRYARTLEEQKGYRDLPGSRYMGSPEKMLMKYRYHYEDFISASLVLKKDAGEEFFTGSNTQGFDFTSFSVGFYNLGRLKKVVVGDYSLQFGQGLTLWSGFSFGKGADVASVAKRDVGLKAYTSSNEASFFRGLASTTELINNIHLTSFVSYRKLDASQSLLKDSSYAQVNISSSGLHRTPSELKNRKSLPQLVYGGALQYLSNNLTAGAVIYRSHYDKAFTTGNQLYNAKGFQGKDLTNAGIHYNYTFLNIYLFGELAHSLHSGVAIINGAMASITPKVSAVVVNRRYDTDHHNFYSQGMGENSESANEKAWYTGLHYNPSPRWSAALYGDFFRFPSLKYRINDPSSGFELMSQVVYQPDKYFRTTIRYKLKNNQQNTNEPVDIKYLDDVRKQNYRVEVNWRLNAKFSFQNRAELCTYKKGAASTENGYLIYQDIDYSPMSSRLSANIRLAYFNTESYDSRVYAYEDDVLYGFSFGMYNGEGARTFLNLKYKLLRQLDFWTRYAAFLYRGTETVGSGLDEIQGNRKSEIKLQLRYQF